MRYSFHNETIIWLEQLRTLARDAMQLCKLKPQTITENDFIFNCYYLHDEESERLEREKELIEVIDEQIKKLDRKSKTYREDYILLKKEREQLGFRKYPEKFDISDRDKFLEIYYYGQM
jgi:hypothetical protein